jgi:protein kinase C substrate 80K-H
MRAVTNACPNGVYFCENRGFKSKIIPSSRLGDGGAWRCGCCHGRWRSFVLFAGVCDCCDGSDEPGSDCGNTCAVLGAAEAQVRARQLEEASKGLETRQLWVAQV